MVRVIKDPKVPIVHIVFEHDPSKLDLQYSWRANKHEDEVTVDCEKIIRT